MSNCIWVDVDEAPSVFSETVRTARKPHKCEECRETIQPGSKYLYESGCWDGSWSSFSTCARCANVRRDYFKGGWLYGNCVEDFRETFGFDYRDGIPKDFAPCEDNRKPRELPPESGTVAMGAS